MVEIYLVEVPNFEHGTAIMERILKETIAGRESIVLTAQDRAIGHH